MFPIFFQPEKSLLMRVLTAVFYGAASFLIMVVNKQVLTVYKFPSFQVCWQSQTTGYFYISSFYFFFAVVVSFSFSVSFFLKKYKWTRVIFPKWKLQLSSNHNEIFTSYKQFEDTTGPRIGTLLTINNSRLKMWKANCPLGKPPCAPHLTARDSSGLVFPAVPAPFYTSWTLWCMDRYLGVAFLWSGAFQTKPCTSYPSKQECLTDKITALHFQCHCQLSFSFLTSFFVSLTTCASLQIFISALVNCWLIYKSEFNWMTLSSLLGIRPWSDDSHLICLVARQVDQGHLLSEPVHRHLEKNLALANFVPR